MDMKMKTSNSEFPSADILLVDDESSILMAVGMYLEDMGYRVVSLESGKRALELIDKSKFDLIITDLVMDDIDGFDVLKKSKELHPDTMVIVLTGYPALNFAIDALRLGADDYILKPCDPEELRFRVVRCLEKLKIQKEMKRSQEALRKSEETLRAIMDHSPANIFLKDRQGKYVLANDQYKLLFHRTHDQIIGKTDYDLFPEETAAIMRKNDEQVFDADGALEFEEIFPHNDGPHTYISIKFPVSIPSGTSKNVCTISTDITERNRLELRLQRAQRMEAIGTLAGGIAHDYNNLLMSIQGHASILMVDKDSNHPDFEHLKRIENAVEIAAGLSQQLLGFARLGKYQSKRTDLNELTRKQASLFGRTRKDITLHAEYEANLWTVEVDPKQVEQVLLNLCINASQAMPEGGDIYIQTKNVFLSDAYVKGFGRVAGKYVNVIVRDTGTGMDEAILERIFDPFFSTKEMRRGAGLGLAAAYGIINNHGGIIDVHSQKGKGTAFSIYLPAVDAEGTAERPDQASKRKKSGVIALGTEKILLVDDEEEILNVGKLMLTKLGYEVLAAKSGREAIDFYKENIGEIDMVILDVIMPGMGGGETFDSLKAIDSDIKVLLSSGYSLDGRAKEILKRGCIGFIQKPYGMRDLSEKLRDVLAPKSS